MSLPSNFTDVFFDPSKPDSIIDVVNPATGKSAVYGETLDEVRKRYPAAEQTTWQEWSAAKAARQDAAVTWRRVSQRQYQEMLEVLPPACWTGRGFLVGEPWDHHARTGAPRFQAFIERNGQHYASSRPLTVAEFREIK